VLIAALDGDFIWNDWYVPFFDFIHADNDVICAVAYINVDWDSQSMWANQGWAIVACRRMM